MESLRMSDSRGSYGSVMDAQDPEVTNKRSQVRSMLICGIVFILVFAGTALVVGTVRANGGTLFGRSTDSMASVKNAPSATAFAAAECDDQEKLLPPDSCVICLSASATPQTTPSRCPAGTYWDEEETCSCIPCEKNFCCLAGDVMKECPVGSFQPNRGGKTCQLIGVGGATNGFEWNPIFGSVLNTKPATPEKVVRTVESPVSCGGVLRKSAALISGMNLNEGVAKVSIKVRVQGENGANTDVSISKVGQSRINGAAFSVVGACMGTDSIMTMGQLNAKKIKQGAIEKRTLVTNLECRDSTPRVFAGIDEIEAVGLDKAFSLSIKASVRSNRNGFVRPRVEFSSDSTSGVLAAGASVIAYCNSEDALFGQGYIESGNIDGSTFKLESKKDSAGNAYISKTVVFANEMKCSEPQVALALTQLDASGGIAVNLQFMSSTGKSFTMRFVAMGGTKITSIKAAYLATCPHDTNAVAQAVKQTCGSVATQATPRPIAKIRTVQLSPRPITTAQPTGKPPRTNVTILPSVTHLQVEALWTFQPGTVRVGLDLSASVYTTTRRISGYCYAGGSYPLKFGYVGALEMPGYTTAQNGSEKMQIHLDRMPSNDKFIVMSLVVYRGATSFKDVTSCKVVLTDMGANKVLATFNMLEPTRRGGNAILLAYFKREQGSGRWMYMPLGKMLATPVGREDVEGLEPSMKSILPTL